MLIIFKPPYCHCMKSNTSAAYTAEHHVQVQITHAPGEFGRLGKIKPASFLGGYFLTSS